MSERFKGFLDQFRKGKETNKFTRVKQEIERITADRTITDAELFETIAWSKNESFNPEQWDALIDFVKYHRPNIENIENLKLGNKPEK